MVEYSLRHGAEYPHEFRILDLNKSFMPVIDWCFKHLERKNLDHDWRYDYMRKTIMIVDPALALQFWMRFGG
jgi:hypothetical protein